MCQGIIVKNFCQDKFLLSASALYFFKNQNTAPPLKNKMNEIIIKYELGIEGLNRYENGQLSVAILFSESAFESLYLK